MDNVAIKLVEDTDTEKTKKNDKDEIKFTAEELVTPIIEEQEEPETPEAPAAPASKAEREEVHPLLDDLRILRQDIAKVQKAAYHRETIEKLYQFYVNQRSVEDTVVDDWMQEREPWMFVKEPIDEIMATAEEVRSRFARVRDKVSSVRKGFSFSRLFSKDDEEVEE